MKTNMRYVVTQSPIGSPLRVGDCIHLEESGDLACYQARGWIEAEYVEDALKGVEVMADPRGEE
jgi:uncharacterized protein YraI